MKTHQLTAEQVDSLLRSGWVGTLATVGNAGTPYVTPIHYFYDNGRIYFHGLPKGQKMDNLQKNPLVCFNVYETDGLSLDSSGTPCDTNTRYRSVTVYGTAEVICDIDDKRAALDAIVDKYTPQNSGCLLPDNMVKGTAVVAINITESTGKYLIRNNRCENIRTLLYISARTAVCFSPEERSVRAGEPVQYKSADRMSICAFVSESRSAKSEYIKNYFFFQNSSIWSLGTTSLLNT